MNPQGPLSPDRLRRRCDPALFDFETTAELQDLNQVIGQDRAIEAITFGIRVRRGGYNLFAAGPTGSGKHYVARRFLKQQAVDEPAPDDWCYVHNTADPHRPRALRLPPGKGRPLRDDMARAVEELKSLIPTALQSDAYRTSRRSIESRFKDLQEAFLREIQHKANERGLALIHTDEGVAIAPMRDGAILSQEKVQSLPSEEQDAITAHIKEVQQELMEQSALLPQWEREMVEALRDLDQQVCRAAVEPLFERLTVAYQDLPDILTWLQAIQEDVISHHHLFGEERDSEGPESLLRGRPPEQGLRRYQVNVLIDHTGASGAPVIYEDHPTLSNLMGRIEHTAMLGALTTDFSLIRAGSLHRANGGYLIIDAHRILSEPMAWDFLKRTMRSGELRIEAPDRGVSHISTVTLEPEPVPIQIKVVLIGERALYHSLERYDPDFRKMFKVFADFDEEMTWTDDSALAYGRLIATLARQDDLRPLTPEAVARLVEHAARLAHDSRKLSTHIQSLWTVLHESDHQAREAHTPHIEASHVSAALDASERRMGRPRERLQERLERGTLMINTSGARVGQINGLSVLQLHGGVLLGQPNRITARVRAGEGGVVNIEREAELSGPIHDKGVLILTGLLGAQYTLGWPLALTASLVFEQSYGGVDGDSASLAELCALVSALSGLPLLQSVAVTGSINQYGEVQAVGGVNAKIEGFFDVCAAKGLDGMHGVILPMANVEHLMLREDVVAAAAQGQFHVWPVEHVHQAFELLMGVEAGDAPPGGRFPEGTINRRVQDRLEVFARTQLQWNSGGR